MTRILNRVGGARALSAILLAAAMLAALSIGWTGFIASDDSLYFVAAEHWLNNPPFAGDNHWATRFPLLWSFAAMIALFGRGFAAFAATAVLWYVVIIVIVGRFAMRVGGERTGWIAAILTATLPVVISNATTVSVDLLETSMLLLGALALGEAGKDRKGLLRGLQAGLCFGTAILCRETSLLSLVVMGPLFLIGRPVRRSVLIAAGVGLGIALGGEALFQWVMTGDPLRRYDIAFHHDSHIDRAANMEGNFLLHPVIDPLLVLLVNDDFGLLFWLAGAAVLIGRRSIFSDTVRGPLIVLAAMALADFLLVAVLYNKLVLNPRYFMLPAILAVIVLSLWLDRSGPRLRAAVIAAMVALSLLLMSVGNGHPRWEMEALVATCRANPTKLVSGDPVTVRRSRLSLRFVGLDNARYLPAEPGGLLVVPEALAPRGTIVARYPSPPTRLGALIEAMGLRGIVPGALQRRMFAPNDTIVAVRAP